MKDDEIKDARSVREAIEEGMFLASSSDYWNVPETTGRFLSELAAFWLDKRGDGQGRILEIGTSNGYSGIWLAKALERTGGLFYTVESHAERFNLADGNFIAAGVDDRVVRVRGHAPEVFLSADAISEVRGGMGGNFVWPGFDFVFMDATKLEYFSYLEAARRFLNPGALVVADNVLSHRRELSDFVKKSGKKEGQNSFLLPLDNGLLLICARDWAA